MAIIGKKLLKIINFPSHGNWLFASQHFGEAAESSDFVIIVMRRRGQEDCENLELAINSEDQSKYPHLLVDEELPCVLLRGIELSILRKLKGLAVIVVAKKE